MFSLKTAAIGAGVALAVGFAGGWKTRDAFCDAAAARKVVAELRTQIEARDAAAKQDAPLAAKAQAEQSRIEGVAREVEASVADRECLSAADTDRLRDLWR